MFIKLTRSGSHTYAQLVESFRDENGKPRQRTVATIGRVDESDGAVDSLLKGLLRARGKSTDLAAAPQVEFERGVGLPNLSDPHGQALCRRAITADQRAPSNCGKARIITAFDGAIGLVDDGRGDHGLGP